jgi:hypothetical protein
MCSGQCSRANARDCQLMNDLRSGDDTSDSQTYLFDGSEYWPVYAYTYWDAAEMILARATEYSFLIHPGLYLVRHYVELLLKKFLHDARQEVPISHDLVTLWTTVRELDEFSKNPHATRDALDLVSGYVQTLAELDPGSFAFRYPVDRNGEPRGLGGPYSAREVLAWARRLHDALGLLDGALDANDADRDAEEEAREIEREMEMELRDYYR